MILLLLLFVNTFKIFFSAIISDTVNINRYNPHKRKFFGVFSNFSEGKRILRPKILKTPALKPLFYLWFVFPFRPRCKLCEDKVHICLVSDSAPNIVPTHTRYPINTC